jgi:cytochrome c oxidase assembly factor CtaG/ferredoxin
MPNATQAAFGIHYGLRTFPVWASFSLLVTVVIYLRGWLALRQTRRRQIAGWRVLCFLLGMLLVWIAIASPLDALSGILLTAHMIQHLLLMAIAPPLLVLGAPMVPLLRGLPRFLVREGIGPFFVLKPVHTLERLFASRVFAWLLMNVSFLGWHAPVMYDLALRSPSWHEMEHVSFLLTSVLFWWHIVAPWPTIYRASRWMLLPFLLTADILNTGLSALLSFSGRVLYPAYSQVPRFFGVSVLGDQVAAGALMWVMGSASFLGAAMLITVNLLSRRREREKLQRDGARAHEEALFPERIPQTVEAGWWERGMRRVLWLQARQKPSVDTWVMAGGPTGTRGGPRRELDLLRIRGLGGFLRWRYGRQTLQALSLLIASAVIVDGLFGHQMASMNLAGIVPWTYGRGIFVMAVLLVGNLFCMSCPFMLPREIGKWIVRRLGWSQRPWPRMLRNKWLPVALVALFFWAYEALAIWNSPMRTAILLLAYFATAFAVDAVFRDASFCKYVCPLGQFNFVSSLLSPVEVAPRAMSVCGSCSTRDCVAGHGTSAQPASPGNETRSSGYQRGCELHLFLPEKQGNMDCTLCLDCVKACPHDNVGLFVQVPAQELVQLGWSDPQRSAVGRYSQRMDVAVLAATVTMAGFASAAVMVAPVANAMDALGARLPELAGQTLGLASAAILPAVLVGLVALAERLSSSGKETLQGQGSRVPRWLLALLPLGLGMWAAHMAFHLATAWNSLWPGILQVGRDFAPLWPALRALPAPDWIGEGSLLSPEKLLGLQMVLLAGGLLGALYVGWRIAGGLLVLGGAASRNVELPVGLRLRRVAPWSAVVVLLYGVGMWILLQPMQMRGMVGM